MKKYVEITLLPDAETPLYFLWEKLYSQLHFALVEVADVKGKVNVGASFPKYHQEKRRLGDKLRLFSNSEQNLEALQLSKWLSRLTDYVHVKKIQDVPAEVEGYAYFSRLIEKGSDAKLARRRAKKLGISYEEALTFFQDKKERLQPKRNAHLYPFIRTKSLSTDDGSNKYFVTIVRTETDALVLSKGFSTYGLSSDSSVPVFR